ncbi:MAG: threonylcarbamoyl-AMP synthase [Clostridiales bacterium]|nr:threonylcarbamoyl-AMP synthase [Clostridiales bacterium]
MNTLIIDPKDNKAMDDAARALRDGEVVAFPTETVYGLGADATNPEAVKKIFKAKGRPSDNPLIVHISDISEAEKIASGITPLARKLMDAFMPGPITVIVRKDPSVIPDAVSAGLDTVGIRMPSDPICRKFLRLCRTPVAAPSANLSGSPSPTKASHVIDDMNGRVYGIINGNDCLVGLESTVVDATGEIPVILRPGAVTSEMIREATGTDPESAAALKEGQTPRAPGMKYRHYAPSADTVIVPVPKIVLDSDPVDTDLMNEEDLKNMSDDQKKVLVSAAVPFIDKITEALSASPFTRIGLFCGSEVRDMIRRSRDDIMIAHTDFFVYGPSKDVGMASHYLFDGLRSLDRQEVDLILAAGFPEEGIGKAYMNRLGKAAGKSGETPGSAHTEDAALSGQDTSLDDVPLPDNVFTSSVLFISDTDLTAGPVCCEVFSDLLRKKGPFCHIDDRSIWGELYCESAGLEAPTGSAADPMMDEALKKVAGLSLRHHLTSHISTDRFDSNDLILCMNDDQVCRLIADFPLLTGKLFSLSSYMASKGLVIKDDQGKTASIGISDPSGSGKETYEHTASALKAWIELLFPYILKDLGAQRA